MKILIGRIKGDYYGYLNRSLRVVLEINLKDKGKGEELSICGDIWKPNGNDIVCGGQIHDRLGEALVKGEFKELYFSEKDLLELLRVWNRWHLNGMRAGCEHQRKLKESLIKVQPEIDEEFFYASNYENTIKIPEFAECPECGYKYGSAWLFEPLPKKVVKFIKQFKTLKK